MFQAFCPKTSLQNISFESVFLNILHTIFGEKYTLVYSVYIFVHSINTCTFHSSWNSVTLHLTTFPIEHNVTKFFEYACKRPINLTHSLFNTECVTINSKNIEFIGKTMQILTVVENVKNTCFF